MLRWDGYMLKYCFIFLFFIITLSCCQMKGTRPLSNISEIQLLKPESGIIDCPSPFFYSSGKCWYPKDPIKLQAAASYSFCNGMDMEMASLQDYSNASHTLEKKPFTPSGQYWTSEWIKATITVIDSISKNLTYENDQQNPRYIRCTGKYDITYLPKTDCPSDLLSVAGQCWDATVIENIEWYYAKEHCNSKNMRLPTELELLAFLSEYTNFSQYDLWTHSNGETSSNVIQNGMIYSIFFENLKSAICVLK